MKKVSVVTINYNSEESTKKLLNSLVKVKTSGFEIEIIVVDNGSKKIFSTPKKYKKQNVILLRSDINTGFSGGNNVGIKEALRRGADFLLLVNNDTIVHPDMIKNLLKVLESDEKIGITAPKIYFLSGHEFHKDRYRENDLGKVIWYAGGYIDWNHAKSVHRGMDEVDHEQYNSIEKTDFVTGCCMMIKKEVLEKVGLFDDLYFLYYEDSDLGERVKKAGYEMHYVSDAILYHENSASSDGAGGSLHDYFLTRNQMIFGMKYAPLRTKIALIGHSLGLFLNGRPHQKIAIKDYYLRRFGKGTYFK